MRDYFNWPSIVLTVVLAIAMLSFSQIIRDSIQQCDCKEKKIGFETDSVVEMEDFLKGFDETEHENVHFTVSYDALN